uniref:plasmid recombination protein n=1 Tax=Sporosarcina koreensis TaxID=334735 RepID=UPI000AB0D16A
MSYAVCRMQKMKSHDLKGIQFHNKRERESKTNPDIDKDKSNENYDFINDGNI